MTQPVPGSPGSRPAVHDSVDDGAHGYVDSRPDSVSATDACYRHPDRPAGVRCQRCDRPICPDCMNSASVGFQCPVCWAGETGAEPAERTPAGAVLRVGQPRVTIAFLLLNVLVFVYMRVAPPADQQQLMMLGDAVPQQPWRLLTAAFAHQGFLHIAMNMFMLWQLGPALELLLGRWRFAALYLLSGLGGSVAVWILAPDTYTLGASGAILGLVGALLVFIRSLGGDITSLLIYVALMAYISFTMKGVSWQGHLGGFIAGLIVAVVIQRIRPNRPTPTTGAAGQEGSDADT